MEIKSVSLTTTGKGMGHIEIEIPIEKIVDGEVVTIDTKSIPIIPIKME